MKIGFFAKIYNPKDGTKLRSLKSIKNLKDVEGIGYDTFCGVTFGGIDVHETKDKDNKRKKKLIWITYRSNFTYTIETTNKRDTFYVEYNGAFNGFLRQSLLPYFEVLKIMEVNSSLANYDFRAYDGVSYGVFMKSWNKLRDSLEWEDTQEKGMEVWLEKVKEKLDALSEIGIDIDMDDVRPLPKNDVFLNDIFDSIVRKEMSNNNG